MKRASKTRSFVLLLLLSVGGGCTQSFVEEEDIPPHALTDVDAGFTLKVLATRTPVTRSITFTPEGTIESDTLAVGVKGLGTDKSCRSANRRAGKPDRQPVGRAV